MSNFQLLSLGVGNAFNQSGYSNSSFLLNSAQSNVLIDFGFTTQLSLQKQGIDLSSINNILITHFHGDHTGGLPAFLLAKKYIAHSNDTINIFGPQGIEKHTKALQKTLYSGTESIFDELNIQFHEIEANEAFEIDELKVHSFAMKHAPESLGYLFENEKSIGFTGDTAPCENLEKLIEASDIIVGECSEVELKGEVKHLDLEYYRNANPSKTYYLCHYNQNVLDAAQHKFKNIIPLKEGTTYQL